MITRFHPGYIYPEFVRTVKSDFFKRKLLVYGEATKTLLINKSIFMDEQIEVIGNPRISMYKKLYAREENKRNLILFASQPYYIQSGKDFNYYATVIPILKCIKSSLSNEKGWNHYKLAVKLHPIEASSVKALYSSELPGVEIYGSDTDLFEVLSCSYLHITATSTTLYEAAEFEVPSLMIRYANFTDISVYGFPVKTINDKTDTEAKLREIMAEYDEYLEYLIAKTREYM